MIGSFSTYFTWTSTMTKIALDTYWRVVGERKDDPLKEGNLIKVVSKIACKNL
uniref:Uncharacterized protein n=2 Tax=Arundo donax TaxID=35708 RepID=A0A0A9FVU8_ARUDO